MSTCNTNSNNIITECTICTEKFNDNRIPAIGACNHGGICSICYLRMRALGKDLSCPMCKTKLEHVICYYIHQFERFSIWGETCSPGDYAYDHHSAMFFPNRYYKKIESLWIRKCNQCPETNRDMKIMKTHLQTKHSLIMCGLCMDNKQCFPSEQKIYNQQSVSVNNVCIKKIIPMYDCILLLHYLQYIFIYIYIYIYIV